MKRKTYFAVLLLSLVCATGYGNLVQNPSMERDFIYQDPLGDVAEGWTAWEGSNCWDCSFGMASGHEGNKSQLLESTNRQNVISMEADIYQQIGPLEVGKYYRVSMWCSFHLDVDPGKNKCSSGFTEITFSVGVDTNGDHAVDYSGNLIVHDWHSGWKKVMAYFPANSNHATVFLSVDGMAEEIGVDCDTHLPSGLPMYLDAYSHFDDVNVESIQIGAGSTIEATSPVPADGVTHSEVTITVVDSNSNPIQGIPPSEILIDCTGSGHIITGPSEPTDENGQTVARITSTVAEKKLVIAIVLGRLISNIADVEFFPDWAVLTIETSPNDVNTVTPTAGDHNYAPDTVVDITASRFVDCPDIYVFDYWEGDVNDVNSPETTITMDDDKTVIGVFVDGRKCGDECHPYPVGDTTFDCIVDLRDIAKTALHWLECTKPECD